MGIPWAFEILATFFNNEGYMWIISDEINALQGVMIFLIFAAKSKIFKNIKNKLRSSLDNSESTKMNTISGSSFNASGHNNDLSIQRLD